MCAFLQAAQHRANMGFPLITCNLLVPLRTSPTIFKFLLPDTELRGQDGATAFIFLLGEDSGTHGVKSGSRDYSSF